MATFDVYNWDCEKVSTVDLSDGVFGTDVKDHLLYSVVRYQMARRRQGTHAVKGRSMVSGGGRKPFKQKGTGRARAGTTRAPHWRGGGVVFGPVTRDHGFKLNKKVRAAALRSALSRRSQESAVFVLDTFDVPGAKTAQVAALLGRLELTDALIVLEGDNETGRRSARNLPGVTVVPPEGLNVYDILNRKAIVMTKAAAVAIDARLGS